MEGRRVPPPPPPKMQKNDNLESEVKTENSLSEQSQIQSEKDKLKNMTTQNENQPPVQKKKFMLNDKAKTVLLSIGAIAFLLGGVACFIMLFL